MTDNNDSKGNIPNTHKGMVVKKDSTKLHLSIVGQNRIYTLVDENLYCVLEPLTRIEFLGELNSSDFTCIVREIVAFNNALKIKFNDKILLLIKTINSNIQSKLHLEKPYFELQELLKDQHIPFALYGFNILKIRFWLNEIEMIIDNINGCIDQDDLDTAERLVQKIQEKRSYYLEKSESLKLNFENSAVRLSNKRIESKQLESSKVGQFKQIKDYDDRILVSYTNHLPSLGEIIKVSFYRKLGNIQIKHIGKSFAFSSKAKGIPASVLANFKEGELVCYLYYETADNQTINVRLFPFKDEDQSEKDSKIVSHISLLNEVRKLQSQFELDGIKPRQSTEFKADIKSFDTVCDMRKLDGNVWFLIGVNYIWCISNKPSNAPLFHNLNFEGSNVAAWVLNRLAYKDVEITIREIEKSIMKQLR